MSKTNETSEETMVALYKERVLEVAEEAGLELTDEQVLDEMKMLEKKEGGLTDFFHRNPGIEL